jgi:hypothetical protein
MSCISIYLSTYLSIYYKLCSVPCFSVPASSCSCFGAAPRAIAIRLAFMIRAFPQTKSCLRSLHCQTSQPLGNFRGPQILIAQRYESEGLVGRHVLFPRGALDSNGNAMFSAALGCAGVLVDIVDKNLRKKMSWWWWCNMRGVSIAGIDMRIQCGYSFEDAHSEAGRERVNRLRVRSVRTLLCWRTLV